MLLVNVHELQVILADSVVLAALEENVEYIGCILGLEGEDVFVLGGTENFGQGCEIHSQSNVSVTSVRGKGLGLQKHRDKGNVRVVHSLERDTRVIAVEVAVLDQVLDGVDHLRIVIASVMTIWRRGGGWRTFFRRLACSRRASNIFFTPMSAIAVCGGT